jgi:hypothetical protein
LQLVFLLVLLSDLKSGGAGSFFGAAVIGGRTDTRHVLIGNWNKVSADHTAVFFADKSRKMLVAASVTAYDHWTGTVALCLSQWA